jgi:hypothetical protein
MLFPNTDPQLCIELNRIVPMPEAARLSSLSEDTLEKDHPDKIVWLSDRRKGMRVGHALFLDASNKKDTA